MGHNVDLEFLESHHHGTKSSILFKFSIICVWLALALLVLLCFVLGGILIPQLQSDTNPIAQEFEAHSMKHHDVHLRLRSLQAVDVPHTNVSVMAACNATPYPKLCAGMLQSAGSVLDDPQIYVVGALTELLANVNQVLKNVTQCRDSTPVSLNSTISSAFNDCVKDYNHSIDDINSSISTVQQFNSASPGFQLSDLQAFMGAVLAYHQDCLGKLQGLPLLNVTGCDVQGVTFTSSSDVISELLSIALWLINTFL